MVLTYHSSYNLLSFDLEPYFPHKFLHPLNDHVDVWRLQSDQFDDQLSNNFVYKMKSLNKWILCGVFNLAVPFWTEDGDTGAKGTRSRPSYSLNFIKNIECISIKKKYNNIMDL